MVVSQPYNPLDKRNLAKSVADQLLARPVEPLPPKFFLGAGVYAIYYVGDFSLYRLITQANHDDKYEQPIYVGKAVPRGARKGIGDKEYSAGRALFDRLSEHADSIDRSSNLNLSDFLCRYLIVDDIWIPLGESLLIDMFKPVWNVVVEGFGNHDPGSGRVSGRKSNWDVLHPGRPWADKLKPGHPEERIRDLVVAYLSKPTG